MVVNPLPLSRSIGSRYDGAVGATALDTRLTLAALLAQGGSGLAARPGVLPGAPAVLVTGTAGPGWAYQVAAAPLATSRGVADGAHILTNTGPESVATIAAPGTAGTSRIEIIYALQPSKGENSDTSSTPVFGVARGNASTGTPVPPTLPPGALELARNTMAAGATSTASSGNTITQTWRYTALLGAPIYVRSQAERDELTALASASNPITVDRLDLGVLECNRGAGWEPVGPGAWVPYTPAFTNFIPASSSIAAAFTKVGAKTVHARGRVTLAGSIAFNTSNVEVSLPYAPIAVAAAADVHAIGTSGYKRAGTGWWNDFARLTSSGRIALNIRSNNPVGPAANDIFTWDVTYEAA